MLEHIPPVLPDCLIPDWEANTTLQERHAELQHTSLEDYRAAMPSAVQQSVEGLHFVDTFAHNSASIEDEKSALIVPIPFATGWRPHIAARVDLLNAAIGGGQRVIALPNSVYGATATQYTRKERAMVARGNFAPLQEKILRLLDAEGVERVSVAGYSQGSVMGAHIAKAVNEHGAHQLEAAALSDMPTVVQRSAGRLASDFVRTGTKSYIQAMDGAAIPLLRESVQPANGLVSALEFAQYLRTVSLPENRALAASLRCATFGSVVLAAACKNDARFGLMRAENSTVTPKEPYDIMLSQLQNNLGDRVTSVEIPGYGHEFGDHSVALALVEARALRAKS